MSVDKKIMEVEMFHEENVKRETTRKKTKCVSVARLAILIFIFFSFGVGFYKLVFKISNLFNFRECL